MKTSERAAQLWPVLMFAAFHRQTTDLEVLGRLLGVPAPELPPYLAPVRRYCLDRGIPDLTSIVVDDAHEPSKAERADIREARIAAFHHHWLDEKTPGPSDFAPFSPS